MSMHLGYLLSTLACGALFAIYVIAQIEAAGFRPILFWATIVATTTVGTTLADFADRSLGIGYAGGATLLLACVLSSLYIWHRTAGSVAVHTVSSPKVEAFYWITIMLSQTLGTALGDWMADTVALGYERSAVIFATLLAICAVSYRWTNISRTGLFWVAFVLTRPLGAVVGDFLDKPAADGGLAFSRYTASGVLLALIAACIFVFPQRPAVGWAHPNIDT